MSARSQVSKVSQLQSNEIIRHINSGQTVAHVASLFGLSTATVLRHERLREEEAIKVVNAVRNADDESDALNILRSSNAWSQKAA